MMTNIEGKLVHISGSLTINETLTDPKFKVTAPGHPYLERCVEMLQWVEVFG